MKSIFLILALAVAISVALPSEKNAVNCSLCKMLVKNIEEQMTDPTNEQAVADALKKGCDLLFPNNMDMNTSCKNSVDASVPQIIDAIIANYGDPTAICTALKACP